MDTTEIKQHSVLWHKNKLMFLGANDVACLLNNGYSDKDDLIEQKINYVQQVYDEQTTKLLDRGTRYEPIVRELCGIRNGCHIEEVGQRFHSTLKFLTASPDGIIRSPSLRLVEFKVHKKLDTTIPLKFWIQMQVQMEVWNIDSCLFCANLIYEYNDRDEYLADSGTDKPRGELRWNGSVYYWKLDRVYEQVITRDRQWFSRMKPEIESSWQIIKNGREQNELTSGSKRKRPLPVDMVRKQWHNSKAQHITQYNLSNWALDDPLLDWLNTHKPKDKDRDPPHDDFSLSSFIYEQAVSFKLKFRSYLKSRTPKGMFVDIDEWYHPTELEIGVRADNQQIYYDGITRTQKAIDDKIPVIFNACLADHDHYFYGKADLLVNVRYLHDLIAVPDVFTEGELDHYIIISTKFATLDLCADGLHLLSNSKQKVYKIHLAFLNVCLSKMQGFTSGKSLIIGRKSHFTTCGNTIKSDQCFKYVGVVDLSEKDSGSLETMNQAIDWIKTIRDQSSKDWTIDPPCRKELAPNMKNQRDYPWHNLKKTLATKNNEITMMYRCGPQKRNRAWDQGVENWMDITPDTIGVHAAATLTHITNFISANTTDRSIDLLKIKAKSKDKVDLVVNMPTVEFYVDFEAVNDLGDDFSTFPTAGGCSMIYMIGCLMVNNKTGQKIHNTFIVDRLKPECEKQIVSDWISSMKTMSKGQTQNIYVYHWGNAEKWMLTRALGTIDDSIILIDLCDAFKKAFSAISGTFGYGIKQIGKALFKSGEIKTIWVDNIDGGSAMVAGWKAEEICARDNCKLNEVGFIKDMIKYNYIDCKVMEEIVDYLRHIS